MRRIILTLALAVLALPAAAAGRPTPGLADARVRTVRYDPDQVVELTATLGYQLMIEFGPGERIENVAIGDSLGWQITPNHKADLLFLKALDPRSRTNMAVVTNLRRYNFSLSARPSSRSERDVIFGLRFDYPAPAPAVVVPPPPPPPPRDVNHAYTFSGSDKGLPSRVFDDGRATYFAFPPDADIPAIFVIDEAGRESVTNVVFRDSFLVIEQLAPQFVLRRGTEATRIVNEGFVLPAAATLAPHKPQKKGR